MVPLLHPHGVYSREVCACYILISFLFVVLNFIQYIKCERAGFVSIYVNMYE